MNYQATCIIENDHPSLDGHFPGNPVSPGVVILNKVIQIFHDWKGAQDIVEIRAVKFMAPVRPGMPFDVKFSGQNTRNVKFECWHDETCLAKGSIKFIPEAGGR